jgi:alkylation response protein AidB-like acyl-CoA dehydrogenase
MFGTRLNPTKPPAHFRATLERAGAACRKARALRQSTDRDPAEGDAEIHDAFVTHGLFGIGVPRDADGTGDEELLVAMALERIGREGLDLASRFLNDHAVAASVISLFGTGEQRNNYLPRMPSGQCVSLFHRWIRIPDSACRFTYETISTGFIIDGCFQPERVPHNPTAMMVVAHDQANAAETCFIVDAASFTRRLAGPDDAASATGCSVFALERIELPQSSALGTVGSAAEVLRAARMQRRLGLAAGAVGAIAEHLERFLEWLAMPRDDAAPSNGRSEIHIAHTATDLEAARALAYAAAELKAEFNRRPRSDHVAKETNTLVCEALHFAAAATRRMTDRIQSLNASDPNLAMADMAGLATFAVLGCSDEATRMLENEIGGYYLQ